MKKTLLSILFLAFLAFGTAGCGDDVVAVPDTLINFTMGAYQTQTGGVDFTFTPSANVKLTKLIVTLPSTNFSDTLTDAGTDVFSANTTYALQRDYTGVQSGQTFIFYFTGSLASNNTPFTNAADTLTIQ